MLGSLIGWVAAVVAAIGLGFAVQRIEKIEQADPQNFDAKLGREFAREDAIRQVWPLMGFSLRDRLAAAA